MATYVPNATDTTQPTGDKMVGSAADEFRTLKTSINARIQALQDELDAFQLKALQVPESSIGEIPALADRANRYFAWDASGDPIASAGTISEIIVSPFMEGVVALPSEATVKAALELGQFVAVTDAQFGAADPTGIASSQTAIEAAVAYCLAEGVFLYWPEGEFASTGNIPNFHSVRHYGPGKVKRGSVLFHVSPGFADANTFYVATTGSTANDGLAATEPTLPQTACNRLTNYGPMLNGEWTILLADGIYDISVNANNSCILPEGLLSIKRIKIKAATALGGFRVTPAVVIDRGSATAYTAGVGGSGKIDVHIQDIKTKGFKAGATPDAEGFHAGFKFGARAVIEFYNCHTEDSDIGIYTFNYVSYTVRGCKFDSVATGFQELFHVTRTISSTAGEHSEVNLYATSNTYGLRAKELCTGHGNGLRVYDGWCGVHLSRCSTINMSSALVHRCAYGVMPRNGSSAWINNVDFGFGTANVTAVPFIVDSTSAIVTEEEELHSDRFTGRGEKIAGSYSPSTPFGHTGTVTETAVTTFTKLRQGAMAHPGSYVKCVVLGRKSGAAGTATVFFRYGVANTCSLIVPATETQFKLEFNLFTKTKGTQQAWSIGSGVSGNFVGRGDRTFNFDSGTGNLALSVQLANAADSITIDGAWVYTTEGLIEESLI